MGLTYVAVEDDRILAFATVAAASLGADDLPTGRRMPPYPLPVLRIARLAVGRDDQGPGLGWAMLRICVELAEVEGGQRVVPLPQMMFLPLGAVPPRR